MNVYGELTAAQAENLTADPTLASARKGRLWYRTDLSTFKVDLGGSADTLAMLAATQTFSGKSFSDAVTMAQIASPSAPSAGFTKFYAKADGTMYQIPNGGTESQVGAIINAGTQYKQIATPSSPGASYQYLYPKSDGNFYTLNSSGVETQIGSGGSGGAGKNYLAAYNGNTGNGDFEKNATTGWSLFNTTLTSLIPTGAISAGAGSVTTFNTVAAGQLGGKYSLQTASSAAWSAGQGFISDAFTIDIEDQAKVLTFKAYYKVVAGATNMSFAGTSANSFAVYIYDTTASAWIQPAGVYGLTQNSGVGYVTGTFQTTSSSTQYRLAIVCINATAGAVTMYWDDVSVGPQTAPLGAVATDWVAYTPTTTAMGTLTNVFAFWRRVGDSIQVKASWKQGTASGTAAPTFSLPSGLSIDTTKVSTANTTIGLGNIGGAASAAIYGTSTGIAVTVDTSAPTVVQLAYHQQGTAGGTCWELTSNGANTNTWAEIFFEVPVAGWSSNVQTSNDTETRVVAAYTIGTSTTFTTGGVTYDMVPTTVSKDTHAGYTGAIYKIPVSGFYMLGGFIRTTTNVVYAILSYSLNGGISVTLGEQTASVANSLSPSGQATVFLNAGDTIKFQGTFSVNATVVAEIYTNIFRLSGPSVVAATESVVLAAQLNAVQSVPNNTDTVVVFDTVVKDSHNAYSAGTWTAPVSGCYLVSSMLSFAANATGARSNHIKKNGSYTRSTGYNANATTATSYTNTSILRLLAGDTVTIVANQSSGGALNLQASLGSTGDATYVSITRIGNY